MLPYKWEARGTVEVRDRFQVITNLVDMRNAEVETESPVVRLSPLRHSVSQESLFPPYTLLFRKEYHVSAEKSNVSSHNSMWLLAYC